MDKVQLKVLRRGTKHDRLRWAGMNTDPKTNAASSVPSNAEKDPDEWATGAESMTGAQASYLKTLCEEAGEAFDPNLSKAEASKRIDALQSKTGRGRDH
jgi:hypothetical protein